jgi:hypothetical protein
LSNGSVELIATTDVGPRILHLGFAGGQNLFHVDDDTLGLTGGPDWHSFGGHRLWHAPEVFPRTYAPDNDAIDHDWNGTSLTLRRADAANRVSLEIELTLDPVAPRVAVRHRIGNTGPWAIELAPWSISVMAPGGRAVLPQEPFTPHPDSLLPARPVVLWSYTDMSDPRWTWGCRAIELRQDEHAGSPQKAGLLNSRGWAAYVLGRDAMIVRFTPESDARYPDFGCNTEVFTNQAMLELEILGPLRRLDPGEHVDLQVAWELQRLPDAPWELQRDRLMEAWDTA